MIKLKKKNWRKCLIDDYRRHLIKEAAFDMEQWRKIIVISRTPKKGENESRRKRRIFQILIFCNIDFRAYEFFLFSIRIADVPVRHFVDAHMDFNADASKRFLLLMAQIYIFLEKSS